MHYSDRQANQFENPQNDKALSVSSLNNLAKSLLESNFPAVIVEGEISNLAVPSSGHWYLTLKDKSSQIRCAMFVNRNRAVRFKPENGNQVILRGRLSIYEGRGDYQLIINSMEEAGDGALQRAFEQLKLKLLGEGLFAAEAKQQVLSHYKHVGVITSPTGAAIQDILSVFARRFPATQITLFPVAVQGKNAPGEIVTAIELANRHAAKLNLQALIVGRGGGSIEDLQAFNEEVVARAIYSSVLPICSAVGHEVDFTIADFVADLRAPTPSAAAEQMSPDQQDYIDQLTGFQSLLQSAIKQVLQQVGQQLIWLTRQLKHPDRRLQEHTQNLDQLEVRMRLAMVNRISQQKSTIMQLGRGLLANSPAQKLQRIQIQLSNNLARLTKAIQTTNIARQSKLASLSRSLNTVSPLNTLARGYSITTDESAQVIRNCDDVRVGSTIISKVHKGQITSRVESVLPDES
ncbi:MAG: exodeoxyribonuclease VII large subunit [SAR86 cluster bacterium]|uniref:Exodeoxyribonuclease 7 large subunit n=1 Tax=SAR86 cluster bacterium TaxID=2030880 RepID=A0A2A5B7B8_9GAMM|nr:MAG: exodeoxyribonuclease VII large subunit [SAR86 cluster bacterium]